MAPVFAVAASVLDSRDREVVVQSRRVIFLRVGRIVRRAHWTTGTLLDLQVMLLKAFDAPPELAMLRAKSPLSAPYVLTHSTFASGYVDASPLLWPDVDLREGSVVSVKDPLWQAVCTLCSSSVGGERRAPRLSAIADDASSSAAGGIDEGATARAKLEADAAQQVADAARQVADARADERIAAVSAGLCGCQGGMRPTTSATHLKICSNCRRPASGGCPGTCIGTEQRSWWVAWTCVCESKRFCRVQSYKHAEQ